MLPNRIPASSVVKNTVRGCLNGKWPSAIVVGLMPVFLYYAFSLILSAIVSVWGAKAEVLAYTLFFGLMILFWLPLFYGVIRWFWRLTDMVEDDVSSVFYFFKTRKLYFRAFKLSGILIFKTAIILLVCLVPYFAVQTFPHIWLYDIFKDDMPTWAINFIAFKRLFNTVGILLAAAISLRYYLTPIIAVMDDNLLILEAVHISKTLSKKSLSAFVSLCCSNVFWIAISLLLLPQIYTMPFLIGCYVVHSRFVIKNYNLNLEFYEKNRFNGF